MPPSSPTQHWSSRRQAQQHSRPGQSSQQQVQTAARPGSSRRVVCWPQTPAAGAGTTGAGEMRASAATVGMYRSTHRTCSGHVRRLLGRMLQSPPCVPSSAQCACSCAPTQSLLVACILGLLLPDPACVGPLLAAVGPRVQVRPQRPVPPAGPRQQLQQRAPPAPASADRRPGQPAAARQPPCHCLQPCQGLQRRPVRGSSAGGRRCCRPGGVDTGQHCGTGAHGNGRQPPQCCPRLVLA